MQGWERAINTLSVRRPQPHNTIVRCTVFLRPYTRHIHSVSHPICYYLRFIPPPHTHSVYHTLYLLSPKTYTSMCILCITPSIYSHLRLIPPSHFLCITPSICCHLRLKPPHTFCVSHSPSAVT